VIAALGNTDRFGVDWQRQQQNLDPVFKYSISNFYIADPVFIGKRFENTKEMKQ
jgi:hypothetical protein